MFKIHIKYFCIILLCSISTLLAQSPPTPAGVLNDSMLRVRQYDLNKAILVGKKGIQTAKQTNDTMMLAVISDNIAGVFLMMGKYDQAIAYIQEAMYWYRFCGSKADILWCQYYLGIAYSLQGFYDDACTEYQNILGSINPMESKQLYLYVLGELGNIYYYKSLYNKAIEIYQQARASALPDTMSFIANSINLGGALNSIQSYDSSVAVLQEGINYAEKSGSLLRKASLLTNLSEAWKGLERFNDALKSIDEAILIREEANDSLGLSNSYRTKGGILVEKKDFNHANDYYFKSLKIDEVLNIPENIAATYCLIGECLQYKNNHEAALAYFQQSYKIAKPIGAGAEIESALRGQALSFMALNKMKEAINLMNDYIRVHDSIKQADILSLKNNTEHPPKQKMTIKKLFISISFALLICFVIVLLYHNIYLRKNLKNNSQNKIQ